VLLALTGYETALLVVAAVFIGFALIVALVVPRSRPEFPGRRLGIFLAVCLALFAALVPVTGVLAQRVTAELPGWHDSIRGRCPPQPRAHARGLAAAHPTSQ